MSFPDIPPEGAKFAAGFGGSLVSLKWLPGGVLQKLHMLVAGTALSWFVSEPLSIWSGMNAGAAGFFLGLFGMAVVDKLFEVIRQSHVGGLLDDWVRKVLGLPPRLPQSPTQPKE